MQAVYILLGWQGRRRGVGKRSFVCFLKENRRILEKFIPISEQERIKDTFFLYLNNKKRRYLCCWCRSSIHISFFLTAAGRYWVFLHKWAYPVTGLLDAWKSYMIHSGIHQHLYPFHCLALCFLDHFTYPVNVFLKKQGYLPDRHSNVLLNKNSERSINHYRSNCFLCNITSVRHKSHLLSQTKRIQRICLTANDY